MFFGRDDAENDLTDGLLREGFLSTYAYEAARTGRKTLIIGRKGSGKSAICRRLIAPDGYAGPAILITPDDAAGDEIRRFELQGLTGDTAKSLIWRYVFAVQAARHLVAQADVLVATLQFSQWKLQDLAKEYLVNYPFLRSLFALFENTGYVVMRQALQNRFEARRESLHREFPAYAEHLHPQGIIDALYAVSFLGVKRGSQVVYVGGVEAPIQPNETEFHVHPCFRPALGGVSPLELPTFQAAPRWADTRSFRQAVVQADVGFGVGRDARLLSEVIRSCESILRQLSRSDLPAATRDEVSQKVAWVLHDASEKRDRLGLGEPVDPEAHVVTAANYLKSVAEQLAANGIHDERVLRRLDDESRSLIRAVGGAAGGGTGSDSY